LFLTGTATILSAVDLAEINLRAALGLGSAGLRQIQGQHQRGSAAVAGLAEVQRLLQPDRPKIAGLDYALHWQPAETAAGDYYDLMALTHVLGPDYDPRHGDVWGVMVGDVSGHGAAAAMEAVQFDAILRTYKPDQDDGPAGALSYANRHFLSRRSRQRFMTVLAAGYRPDLGELRYANAGHLPLLLRRGGKVEAHGDGDMPLGVLRDTVYRNQTLKLRAGDLIILGTDGVVEARDSAGREFGVKRLLAMVEQGPRRPQALLNSLLEALFRHQGGRIGRDDQTLVVLGIQAAPGPTPR
jgi:sigma-B regulation protein RsbU (phosphoserine phosphatase)